MRFDVCSGNYFDLKSVELDLEYELGRCIMMMPMIKLKYSFVVEQLIINSGWG